LVNSSAPGAGNSSRTDRLVNSTEKNRLVNSSAPGAGNSSRTVSIEGPVDAGNAAIRGNKAGVDDRDVFSGKDGNTSSGDGRNQTKESSDSNASQGNVSVKNGSKTENRTKATIALELASRFFFSSLQTGKLVDNTSRTTIAEAEVRQESRQRDKRRDKDMSTNNAREPGERLVVNANASEATPTIDRSVNSEASNDDAEDDGESVDEDVARNETAVSANSTIDSQKNSDASTDAPEDDGEELDEDVVGNATAPATMPAENGSMNATDRNQDLVDDANTSEDDKVDDAIPLPAGKFENENTAGLQDDWAWNTSWDNEAGAAVSLESKASQIAIPSLPDDATSVEQAHRL